MQRIVILGNAGSGKSTLARRLGERLGLPVVHLDPLFWEPGCAKPDNEVFRTRVAAATAGDHWITEGNYARRTFDLRLSRAQLVIWMDTPRWLCAWRVLWRIGRPRLDLPAGCSEHLIDASLPEFLRDLWVFDRKTRPAIEALRLKAGADVPVVRLKTSRDVEAWLASLT